MENIFEHILCARYYFKVLDTFTQYLENCTIRFRTKFNIPIFFLIEGGYGNAQKLLLALCLMVSPCSALGTMLCWDQLR